MNTAAELVAGRYANALWNAVGDERAADVLTTFERFVQLYLSSTDLQKLFANPAFTSEDKKKILTELAAKSNFSNDFTSFLTLLLERGRMNILGTILEAFREKAMARDKIEPVKIETALPITEEQQKQIVSTLESQFGTKFLASVDIVPELVAGIKLHFLGQTIDSTLTGVLFQMRQKFLVLEN